MIDWNSILNKTDKNTPSNVLKAIMKYCRWVLFYMTFSETLELVEGTIVKNNPKTFDYSIKCDFAKKFNILNCKLYDETVDWSSKDLRCTGRIQAFDGYEVTEVFDVHCLVSIHLRYTTWLLVAHIA